MLARLGLRTRIFLLFAGLAAGLLAALGAGLLVGYTRLGEAASLDAFVQVGTIAGFLILALVAWLWYLFDLNVAKPIDTLAGALRARAHADGSGTVDVRIAQHLGDLAPAAQAAAESLAQTRNALAEAVARETSRLSAEKQRLEALLADVPVGVLLCSGEHQLVFYNGQAVDLVASSGHGPHLDRPLFDYLREGPIRLAYERLCAIDDPDAASDLLCATSNGTRILQARMRLMQLQGKDLARPGYVLTLRDVTADLAAKATRDAFIIEVFERIRSPSAGLSALIAALPEGAAVPGRIDLALREEVLRLVDTIGDLSRKGDALRLDGWQMSLVRASDLIDSMIARIGASGIAVTRAQADPLQLRCDAFGLVSLLAQIAVHLSREGMTHDLELVAQEENEGACIRLVWRGPMLPVSRLEAWLKEPLDARFPDVTGRSVLRDHSTEIWPERWKDRQSLCLPVQQARREVRRPAPVTRTVVYDFDLMGRERHASLADARLDALNYVVFDTETTGLLPQQGDEIVQIAAIRIVNGRIVEGEVFDTLANPGRAIPASSTAVHGITDAMVADAPTVSEALRRFHAFAQGSVLIAHNAPFDMQFLRRREDALGLKFNHPVLDTVLLSAVIFGQHDVHSLDALAHRMGVTIPEETRHTALGDALATAEVFTRLLRALQGRNLATFGAVLGEVRRHARLLKDLNEMTIKS
ncbi:MAG: DNA polymerase III subunit epsilon [Rhodobacteraceae bacterium PARR1]|nr:MAG: DNA polymerase III subunit epsilon [Rhodobacteraceae bacterium PARR1]